MCFAFFNLAKEVAKKLSTPNVIHEFDNILREHGQATVGLCVAVTAIGRRDRLETRMVQWAMEVLKLWTNRPGDNLDPSCIEKYAGSLIRLTTEKE